MGILQKLLEASSQPFDLVSAVEKHDAKNIIRHLATKSKQKNPVAIPYTEEDILEDLDTLYKFQNMYNPTRDEFAAAIVIKMLHLTYKSALNWLNKHGFSAPTEDHLIYIGTSLCTINSLKEFSSSTSIKKYKISTCGDERVCKICKKQNNKTYLLSEAIIGKTAPPFCESCRCIIRPIFSK